MTQAQPGSNLLAAMALGALGIEPVSESDDERAAGEEGLAAHGALADVGASLDALLAIDKDHPDLGIKAELEEIGRLVAGGDVFDGVGRVRDLLERHSSHLPEGSEKKEES